MRDACEEVVGSMGLPISVSLSLGVVTLRKAPGGPARAPRHLRARDERGDAGELR